jgi:hypothetical protein
MAASVTAATLAVDETRTSYTFGVVGLYHATKP